MLRFFIRLSHEILFKGFRPILVDECSQRIPSYFLWFLENSIHQSILVESVKDWNFMEEGKNE